MLLCMLGSPLSYTHSGPIPLGSLLDILKHLLGKSIKGGLLPEDVIATVLKDVLHGLDYLHSAGQIHRSDWQWRCNMEMGM